MSSGTQGRFLKSVLSEVKKHKAIYKLAEIKTVIAKREDIPHRKGKWHNVLTLVKILNSGNPSSWKKLISTDNFAVLSATLTISHFKKILRRLAREETLEVEEYQAFGPFKFERMKFVDSRESQRIYMIEWAANVWRVVGIDNLGVPSDIGLELGSETLPFENVGDAIRYYTGLIHEGYSEIQNSICIVAPLYYARIKGAALSAEELVVEVDCNLVKPKDLKIAFNTEGPHERSPYYKTLEANTIQLNEASTTVNLKHEAEMATVWLRHIKGHRIDSHRVRRPPSIETIKKRLTSEVSQLYDGDARVITENIDLRSEAERSILSTTEEGVDSIDVEILKAVKMLGGEYSKCFPEVLKYLSFDTLLSRLSRLRTFGYIELYPPGKILLTPLGVDALNLPPTVLSAKVPPAIGRRISEIKLAFQNENYDEVTNKSTRLLETLLRKRLEEKFSDTLQDVWPNLNVGSFDRASLGVLKEACLRLNVFHKNGVADHILSIILKLRVPMSHEREETASPSDAALLTVKLIEAFVRTWYYLH